MLKINEIFESIQGEGLLVGMPMLFIRLSGCNYDCSFCDTKHHNQVNFKISNQQLLKKVMQSKQNFICFTGGEPLLQKQDLYSFISLCRQVGSSRNFALETNGHFLDEEALSVFDHVTVSPKNQNDIQTISKLSFGKSKKRCEVKVVTDLKNIGVEFLSIATSLMPLTLSNSIKQRLLNREVWQYCVDNQLNYSPRLHIDVWGKKRGV